MRRNCVTDQPPRRDGRRTLRSTIAISLGMVLASTLAACASPAGGATPTSTAAVDAVAVELLPQDIRDRGTLTIASAFDYPPFAHLTEGAEYRGADYELMNEIAARLGLEPTWERLGSFGAIIPAIQSGRFDVAVDGVAALPERLSIVSFVEYFQAAYAVQVAPGNPKGIDADDLCGVNFGATSGAYESQITEAISTKCVEEGKPALSITMFGDAATADTALVSKQVDALVGDVVYVESLLELKPGSRDILHPTEAFWPEQASGIVIRKDAPDLGKAVEAVLNAMQEDGTYQEIMARNGVPEEVFLMPSRFIEES